MKYGSTLRIEVRGLWDENPLFSETVVLSKNINSERTLNTVLSNLTKWYNKALKISQVGQNISDEDLLELAISRGLIPTDAALYQYPEIYYVESESGRSKGHYMELFPSGTIVCSCPGFTNHNKCWASRGLRNSPTQYLAYKWGATREEFYKYKAQDYPIAS